MTQQSHSWVYIQTNSFKLSEPLVLIFKTELLIELNDMDLAFAQ